MQINGLQHNSLRKRQFEWEVRVRVGLSWEGKSQFPKTTWLLYPADMGNFVTPVYGRGKLFPSHLEISVSWFLVCERGFCSEGPVSVLCVVNGKNKIFPALLPSSLPLNYVRHAPYFSQFSSQNMFNLLASTTFPTQYLLHFSSNFKRTFSHISVIWLFTRWNKFHGLNLNFQVILLQSSTCTSTFLIQFVLHDHACFIFRVYWMSYFTWWVKYVYSF